MKNFSNYFELLNSASRMSFCPKHIFAGSTLPSENTMHFIDIIQKSYLIDNIYLNCQFYKVSSEQ